MLKYILLSAILVTSWYGPGFEGNLTANGEIFDPNELTAAHRTLEFGTLLEVSKGDRTVIVRVNDRGPYCFNALSEGRLAPHPERDLDLSRAAFAVLASTSVGVMPVRVRQVQEITERELPRPWEEAGSNVPERGLPREIRNFYPF